jgi:4-hydroxybenzoate polyprenyltransferase
MNYGASLPALFAVFSSFLLSIAVFIFDDARDVKADRVVHPERPIPAGLLTTRQGYIASALLIFVAVLIASQLAFLQFIIFIFSTIIAVAIVFVNMKSTLRASLIALLIWSLFPFAGFPDLRNILFGSIVALPHVGGSIAKDFAHSKGDQLQGLEQPPVWSKFLASLTLMLSSGIVWLPSVLNLVNWLYIPPIVFTSGSCMILSVEVLRENYGKAYIYGGIGMLSSLTAFLLGSV